MFFSIVTAEIIFIPISWYLFLFLFSYIFTKNYYQKIIKIKQFKNKLKKVTNKILIYYNTLEFDIYIKLLYFLYFICLYLYYFLFNIFIYYYNYCNNNIYISFLLNFSSYIYYFISIFLIILTINIFKKNINNQKNFESIFVYYLFFVLLLYYIVMNNLLSLIFIFEFQSLIIIYLLSCLFYLKNNSYQNIKKINKFPIWYFYSLTYQFWISFFSAVFFILSLLIFFKIYYYIDWSNLEINVYMINNKFFSLNKLENIIYFSPFLIGLTIKLGLLPFFFWKPEIYKNFTLELLYIYMTIYIFGLIFIIIYLFYNYLYLINYIYILFYNPIIILTLLILPTLFYTITELRVFLAYSSMFHLNIIIISFIFLKYCFDLSILYIINYLFYTIFILLLMFFFYNSNLWYLVDIQKFSNDKILNIILCSIFLGLAGLPPFFGFFSKLSVLINLYYSSEFFIFFIFLISSLIISFYYIQNTKFYGFKLKKKKFLKFGLLLILNILYTFLLISFVILNNFTWIYVGDIVFLCELVFF